MSNTKQTQSEEVRNAYEKAMGAIRSALPGMTEQEADAVVNAMSDLMFATFNHHINEAQK